MASSKGRCCVLLALTLSAEVGWLAAAAPSSEDSRLAAFALQCLKETPCKSFGSEECKSVKDILKDMTLHEVKFKSVYEVEERPGGDGRNVYKMFECSTSSIAEPSSDHKKINFKIVEKWDKDADAFTKFLFLKANTPEPETVPRNKREWFEADALGWKDLLTPLDDKFIMRAEFEADTIAKAEVTALAAAAVPGGEYFQLAAFALQFLKETPCTGGDEACKSLDDILKDMTLHEVKVERFDDHRWSQLGGSLGGGYIVKIIRLECSTSSISEPIYGHGEINFEINQADKIEGSGDFKIQKAMTPESKGGRRNEDWFKSGARGWTDLLAHLQNPHKWITPADMEKFEARAVAKALKAKEKEAKEKEEENALKAKEKKEDEKEETGGSGKRNEKEEVGAGSGVPILLILVLILLVVAVAAGGFFVYWRRANTRPKALLGGLKV